MDWEKRRIALESEVTRLKERAAASEVMLLRKDQLQHEVERLGQVIQSTKDELEGNRLLLVGLHDNQKRLVSKRVKLQFVQAEVDELQKLISK
jgi:hypothetical protein